MDRKREKDAASVNRMGYGILEDKHLAHVPGTILLDGQSANREAYLGNLKHGTGRYAHIVLAPQPSEDPNDPLNWPMWRKEMIFLILNFGAMLYGATNGPLLNSSLVVIAGDVGHSINDIAIIGGYNLLVAGCCGPFYCALSRRYGKRPIFIFSGITCIVGTAIGEVATTYNMLLAARIVQGLSTSAFESLLISVIGDMYFVHQRGIRVSFANFISAACSNIASIICGQITADLGWPWLFHIMQIFVVVQFVLMVLFCPETTYIRDAAYDIDQGLDEDYERLAAMEHKINGHDDETQQVVVPIASSRTIPAKKTFIQELALYTGTYSHDNLIKLIIAPFVTLLNIGACWATISGGFFVIWMVGTAIIMAGIFSLPPWNLDTAGIGYLSAGPFIGGMIGSLIVATTSDSLTQYMTKKNNGIYEPEFRLLHMPLALITSAVGMFGYGAVIDAGKPAAICALFQGIMMIGVMIGFISTMSYALDAYRDISNEIFIMSMLFKNFMYFGISYFANNWVASAGAGQVLDVFGGTTVFLCLLGLPIWFWGKRLRSFWTRHNLMIRFGMQASRQMEIAG